MSTAATHSLEDCAATNDAGPRWYQLYWSRSEAITLSLLTRAKASGYSAYIAPRTLPFMHNEGIQVCTSDPAFMASQGPVAHSDERAPFSYDPAELNGIVSLGDALKATDMGCEGIVVESRRMLD
ncbi:hypothetical protein HDZ31DRAFT_62405 [Schizophyllum fasciatum]